MKCINLKSWLHLPVFALLLSACHKEKQCGQPSQKNMAVTAFNKITTAETFAVHVVKGAAYNVTAKGCDEDLSDLEAIVDSGRALKLSYKNFKRNRSSMKIDIVMPELLVTDAGGATDMTITGMTGQTYMRFILSGVAKCSANSITSDVLLDLSGSSALYLSGPATDVISGTVSGAATLHAYGLPSGQVDLTAGGASKCYVLPQDKLLVDAGGTSIIYYKGTPAKISTITGGTAKVIKQ